MFYSSQTTQYWPKKLKNIILILALNSEIFPLYFLPAAEATTAVGRYTILETIKKCEGTGIEVLYGDTDSLFIKNPTEEQIQKIIVKNNKATGLISNGKTYEADKVLVTVSIGVLKSNDINFIPELSPDKKKAIQSITFEPGFKAALKFSEKFYPDAINCKVKNGEKVFYDIAFKKNAKTHKW